MNLSVVGKKIGNTRVFDGVQSFHVSIVALDKMYVTSIREEGNHILIQFAYGKVVKHPNKATAGHFSKAKVEPLMNLVEYKVSKDVADKYKVGDMVDFSILSEVTNIDVSGVTRGHGFSGVIKRHGFSMQPATHGNSLAHRAHGSTGQCQDPGRVFKGKKMAGQFGNVNRTIQNLVLYKIDLEQNLLWIKGAIPGPVGRTVKISPSFKKGQSFNLIAKENKQEEAA